MVACHPARGADVAHSRGVGAVSAKYWSGQIGPNDDFDRPIEDVFIDGRTAQGSWAIMSLESWERYGYHRLGMGCGQRYEKQPDGRWLKTDG